MNITMTGGSDALAINGRNVKLMGGKLNADAPIYTSNSLVVDGIGISVTASSPALVSKNLSMKNLSAEYNGDNSFSAKSTAPKNRPSIIFGEDVPGFVDYILLVVFAVGVCAGIFGPALRRKKKAKKLYERLEKEGYTEAK